MLNRNSLRSGRAVALFVAVTLTTHVLTGAEVAHYTFDTNFDDSSGNGNHGVAFDGNSNASTAGVTITSNPGEFVFGGGAANFTIERDWVDIPTQTFGSGNDYSVSFWARDLASGTSNSGGMVTGQPGNTNFFIWLDDSPNGLRWRSSDGSAARQADFSFTDDDEFHHYVLVAGDFDNDSSVDDITLYRDNVLVGSDPNNSTGFIFDAIGEAYATNLNLDFFGQIDELFIFDEAINEEAIGNLFEFNSVVAPVPEPASVALWSLLGLATLGGYFLARRRKLGTR